MSKKVTTESFTEEAIKRRGAEDFDYSKVVYVKAKTKVLIVCKKHSTAFEITPNNFLSGKGCPICANEYRSSVQTKSLSAFIEQAKLCHNDEYDYSQVEYAGAFVNVKIRCKKHDRWFHQTPANHLKKRGCVVCGREKTLSRFNSAGERFIVAAAKYHNFKYDYSKVEYSKANKKVTIVCPTCGEFRQTPNRHLQSGCPCCADYGFNPGKPAVLYLHEIVGKCHTFAGYGITRRPAGRAKLHTKNLNREGYSVVNSFTTEKLDGKFIQQLEKALKDTFPLDTNTSHIDGFKTESTIESYQNVCDFVRNYIENNKEIAYGNN